MLWYKRNKTFCDIMLYENTSTGDLNSESSHHCVVDSFPRTTWQGVFYSLHIYSTMQSLTVQMYLCFYFFFPLTLTWEEPSRKRRNAEIQTKKQDGAWHTVESQTRLAWLALQNKPPLFIFLCLPNKDNKLTDYKSGQLNPTLTSTIGLCFIKILYWKFFSFASLHQSIITPA